MSASRAWLACLAMVTLSCTSYRPLTPAPPGRTATLDGSGSQLRLSRGVALAFECVTGGGNPCGPGQPEVDDSKIARVFPMHANRPGGYATGSSAPQRHVVLGMSPGETWLRIPGESPVRVVVVP